MLLWTVTRVKVSYITILIILILTVIIIIIIIIFNIIFHSQFTLRLKHASSLFLIALSYTGFIESITENSLEMLYVCNEPIWNWKKSALTDG